MESLSWSEILVKNLTGNLTDANQFSETQIDELLTWVSRFSTSNDHLTQICIEKLGSRKGAQIKILTLLDLELLTEPINYIRLFGSHQESKVNRKVLKKRHSQLVKIFHPDRGLVDETWLTKRMEKVNSAYNLVLKKPNLLSPKQKTSHSKRTDKTRNNDFSKKKYGLKNKRNQITGFNNLLTLLRTRYFQIRKGFPDHLKIKLMVVVVVLVSVYLLIVVAGIYLE